MTEAVVLIPGIMGSVLKDGNEVIWPGSALELVFPYAHMAELIKPDLVASDVIRSVSISSQYDHLIKALNSCGFTEHVANPNLLKVFPYDWRKDNALAARGLADCIDKIAVQLGHGAEINLLAHSMGGLVSRYYLESGQYANRPGFVSVKRLVTMGTPHRGAPMALAAAVGQEKRLFLNAQQVKQIASDPNFPSVYQLLPHQGEPFAWDRAYSARFDPIDIYDPAIAAQLGLEKANLDSAKMFHSGLNLARRPPQVRYFFFVGNRQTTTSSVQLQLYAGGGRVLKIDRDDAGDGTVPIWSGSESGVQMEPVGGEHGELYKNGGLQHVLGALLGKSGVLLAAGPIPEISVAQKVVEPGATTGVTIDFPQGTVKIAGVLQLRRVVDASGIEQPNAPVSKTHPITYSGAQIDHLAVLIDAPQFAGVYELAYLSNGSDIPHAMTQLFVQGV